MIMNSKMTKRLLPEVIQNPLPPASPPQMLTSPRQPDPRSDGHGPQFTLGSSV